jgi:iron complex transport system substrate-binding protein
MIKELIEKVEEPQFCKFEQAVEDGKIVYLIEHANVWYTATGGVQALDTMLGDLEGALLNKE